MCRIAFTMIEFIFVIVILGILAAVALPKLTATRDDAQISTQIANTKSCIDEAIAFYTANETDPNFNALTACKAAQRAGTSFSINGDNIVVSNSNSDILNGEHRMKGYAIY